MNLNRVEAAQPNLLIKHSFYNPVTDLCSLPYKKEQTATDRNKVCVCIAHPDWTSRLWLLESNGGPTAERKQAEAMTVSLLRAAAIHCALWPEL